MSSQIRYTVTAALPYTNGPVHIGHLGGVYLPADIYCRYLRLKGEDVLFICGSDEHGVAITIKARKEGITPQELVDKYHQIIKQSFEDFGISFDIYSRTSLPIHHETAQEFFLQWERQGKLIQKTTQQFFDPKEQLFLADRYIIGTCPKCQNENAYGDQCEKCGSSLAPSELINPRSALSGETPILKETSHWYLPLDQYQTFLEDYILKQHCDWKPNVFGQCKSWLNEGLQPRAITRDMDWGVKLPLPNTDGKVLYVWFDAPIGYISATKDLFQQRANQGAAHADDWKPYWQDPNTRLIHFIGKDNIVFHCIIFPIILHGHGDYILPWNVPANEFLNLEGEKISTSRNWAVWLHEYLQDFPGKTDVLRYVLCATMPETKDNDFTWKDFQARNNNELVAILGNFVNRVFVLCEKFYSGKVPAGDIDVEALEECCQYARNCGNAIESFRFREALSECMNIARVGNKLLTETEPWKLQKTNPSKAADCLFTCLQICGLLTVVLQPFLPETAKKLSNMLQVKPGRWQSIEQSTFIEAGKALGKTELLFEKIEDSTIEQQIQKLNATKSTQTVANQASEQTISSFPGTPKPVIQIQDFEKMDIRVATIISAKKVPKTDKLLELQLDTGLDTRTVVSGIAEHYEPETIIGKQILILANLAPRSMRGIVSQGMILLAGDKDGKLIFVSPESKVANGSVVK